MLEDLAGKAILHDMFHYTVYGLTLFSNEPLPPLIPTTAEIAGVEIEFHTTEERMPGAGAQLIHALPSVTPAGESTLQIWRLAPGAGYWFRSNIGDAWAEFHLAEDGRRVEVMQRAGGRRLDLLPPLYGLVLPRVMRLHGVTCLHASAVVVDNHVFAFTGPSETGKSTMLTALVQGGAEFFSDDLLPLVVCDDRIVTHGGFPQVGLWPDSIAGIFGGEVELPYLWQDSPTRPDKRIYRPSAPQARYVANPRPLGGVYLLRPRTRSPEAGVQITAVSGRDAVTQLIPNTTGRALAGRAEQTADLASLARLVRTVPVRKVERPDDLSQIERVAGAILADIKLCMQESLTRREISAPV